MLALATCCLMTLAMGTLHAWSVFSANLEHTLDLSRAQSSLVYSLTLVTLTLTVLFAVPLFERLKPWSLFAIAATMAGLGLLCASSGSFTTLLVGYSLIFGVANGIGYGYALQLSARVFSHRSGFAMGITTASYALGATLGAQILGTLVQSYGSLTTFRIHGISFLLLVPVLAILILKSNASYSANNESGHSSDKLSQVSDQPNNSESNAHKSQNQKPYTINKSLINHYRVSYGLAVFAGLMAMAHAAPFISSFETSSIETASADLTMAGSINIALLGAIVLGLGNAAGGVLAGLAADTFKPKTIVTVLPAIAGISLGIAAIAPSASIALAALVIIGFTYGALIAVYPVAIARHFGPQASAKAYGRIFIAWGVAGLLAPVVAGALHDATQSYSYPLLLAMGLSLVSSVAARRLVMADNSV